MNCYGTPPRKLKFGRQWPPTHHRSGWGYVMDGLDSLHCADGILLDGFIEKKFADRIPGAVGRIRAQPPSRSSVVQHQPAIPNRYSPHAGLASEHGVLQRTVYTIFVPQGLAGASSSGCCLQSVGADGNT